MFKRLLLLMSIFLVSKSFCLTVQVEELPNENNPFKFDTVGAALIYRQLYDNLYFFDEENFLKPKLAKSHIWSPDFKKLTIELKEAKFTDGSVLISDDVIFAFEKLAKTWGSQIKWALGKVSGIDEFWRGEKTKITGINRISDKKIEFNFTVSNPKFIQYLATPYFIIGKFNKETMAPVGTTNYFVKKWNKNSIELGSNNNKENINSIRFVDKTYSKEYEIDISFAATAQHSNRNFEKKEFQQLQAVVWIFNVNSTKLKDTNVRCAIANLTQTIFDKSQYKLEPISKALHLSNALASIQFPIVTQIPKVALNIMYTNSAGHFSKSMNSNLQNEFKKNGVNLTFELKTVEEAFSIARSKKYDILLMGYLPDFPNATALLSPFLVTNQQFNFSGFTNKRLDKILDELDLTYDAKQSELSLSEAFKIIGNSCSTIFLGTQNGIYWKKRNVLIPEFGNLGFHLLSLNRVKVN